MRVTVDETFANKYKRKEQAIEIRVNIKCQIIKTEQKEKKIIYLQNCFQQKKSYQIL